MEMHFGQKKKDIPAVSENVGVIHQWTEDKVKTFLNLTRKTAAKCLHLPGAKGRYAEQRTA